MRPVSKKRQALLRIYVKRRDAFLEANPNCARCQDRACEVHHMAGRVGAALLDESRWLALCCCCHLWITGHPAEAIANGYSLPRIGRTA